MAPEFWYDVDRNGRRRRIKIDAQNHDEEEMNSLLVMDMTLKRKQEVVQVMV